MKFPLTTISKFLNAILAVITLSSFCYAIELDKSFGNDGLFESPSAGTWSKLQGVQEDQGKIYLYGKEGGWNSDDGNLFIRKYFQDGQIDTNFGEAGSFSSYMDNFQRTERIRVWDMRRIENDLRLVVSTNVASGTPYVPIYGSFKITADGIERIGPLENEGIADRGAREFQARGILSDGKIWGFHYATNAFGLSTFDGYPIRSFGKDGWAGEELVYPDSGEGGPVELASGKILLGRQGRLLLIDENGTSQETFDENNFFAEISSILSTQESDRIVHQDAYELPNGLIRILGRHLRGDGSGNSSFITDVLPSGGLAVDGKEGVSILEDSGTSKYRQSFLPNGSIAQLSNGKLEVLDALKGWEKSVFDIGGHYVDYKFSGNDIFAWTTTAVKGPKKFQVYKFALTDTDGDSIEDSTELTIGTSIDKSDTDEDGVSDWEELVLWNLDPLVSDTDKDGFGDGFEIQAGFNPKDANSKPSALIEIQPAVEISINAELGKTYTLQHSTDMNDWTDSGVTVVGTGRVQNFYRPTIKQQMKYWRVVEVK